MVILKAIFRNPAPPSKPILARFLAIILVSVYFSSNVLFVNAAENEFWESRRRAAKESRASAEGNAQDLLLARLPGGGTSLDGLAGPKGLADWRPAPDAGAPSVGRLRPDELPRWLDEALRGHGALRDVYLSKTANAPLVIHIQDLHDSTEAQTRIAALIQSLGETRGVSLVGLEGAQGPFSIDAFRGFPTDDIARALADYFLKEGRIGGAEFAGLTQPKPPLLWGVEDNAAYLANIESVRASSRARGRVEKFLAEAEPIVAQLKSSVFSPRLLEFDRRSVAFDARKEALGSYVRFLFRLNGKSAGRCVNLRLLDQALQWEESLDFKHVDAERRELLEVLTRRLPAPELKLLLDDSVRYRLGMLTYGAYYRKFRDRCKESGIDLEHYGHLSGYIRYVLLAEQINRNDLLTELSDLENRSRTALTATPEERELMDAGRRLALLDKLVRHAFSPADWSDYGRRRQGMLNLSRDAAGLTRRAGREPLRTELSAEDLKPFEDFCSLALARNAALVENLLAKMKSEGRSQAVLVAGGFHTDGLTQILRHKDVSYAVVTPMLTGALPEGSRTIDVLARDPLPLEKLFAGEAINVVSPRPTADSAPRTLKRAIAGLAIAAGISAALAHGVATSQDLRSKARTLPEVKDVSIQALSEEGRRYFVIEWFLGSSFFDTDTYKGGDEPLAAARTEVLGTVPVGALRVSIQPSSRTLWRPGLLARKAAGVFNGLLLQKPATRKLLDGWAALRRESDEILGRRLQRRLGRSPILSTALLEESGAISKWEPGKTAFQGFMESRGPAVLVGAVLAVLQQAVSLEPVAGFFAAAVLAGFWTILGPAQRRFVREHGDQTHLERVVRMFGVALFNIAPLLIGLAIPGIADHFGLALSLPLMILAAAAAGFAAAVGVHAFYDDLLIPRPPPRSFLPIPDSWSGDPLAESVPGKFNEDLAKKIKGKTIEELKIYHRAEADNDYGGKLNEWMGKPTVGVMGTHHSPLPVVSPRAPPYWAGRYLLGQVVRNPKQDGTISNGVGGDEYQILFEGENADIRAQAVIDGYHDELNGRYKFFAIDLSSIPDPKSVINLLQTEADSPRRPYLALVKHGRGDRLVVGKSSPDENLKGLTDQLRSLGVGVRPLKAERMGRGPFTISLGMVSLAVVVERLILATSRGEWLDENGRLRKERVAEVIEWSQRFAEDAMGRAKERGRHQVYSSNTKEMVMALERPESVTLDTVAALRSPKPATEVVSEPPAPESDAFSLSPPPIFWDWIKKLDDVDRKKLILYEFAVTQYHQGRWDQMWETTLTRALASLPAAFMPENWVRRFDRGFLFRAFHHFQGSDKNKGNAAIEAHFKMARESLGQSHRRLWSRAVDNFLVAADNASPTPSLAEFDEQAAVMAENLRDRYPKDRIQPFHVVFRLDLSRWPSNGRNLSQAQILEMLGRVEGFLEMKSKVITDWGRKGGKDNLKQRLNEDFGEGSAELGESVLMFNFIPTDENIKKLEEYSNDVQEAESALAEASFQSRAPPRTGSWLFEVMAVILQKTFDLSPARARQIVTGRYVQGLFVPLIEFPLFPGMALAGIFLLTGAASPFGGMALGSFLAALLHGWPKFGRGPPDGSDLPWYRQTPEQLLVRFAASSLINGLALFTGIGFSPEFLLESSQSLIEFSTPFFLRTFAGGILFHALYNYFVPERFRLSLIPGSGGHAGPGTGTLETKVVELKNVLRNRHQLARLGDSEAGRTLLALIDLVRKTRPDEHQPRSQEYPLSFALRVAGAGGSLEAVAAAMLGGLAILRASRLNRDPLQSIINGLSEDHVVDRQWLSRVAHLAVQWHKVDSIRFNPPDNGKTIGIIRNQMGLLAQNLGEVRPGDVLRMVMESKILDLEALPEKGNGKKWYLPFNTSPVLSLRQRKLIDEITYVYAPWAERLGQDALASRLREEVFRVAHPETYLSVAKDLYKYLDPLGFAREGEKPDWDPRAWHAQLQESMDRYVSKLEIQLNDGLARVDPERKRRASTKPYVRLGGRVKGIASIHEKMGRDKIDLKGMHDIFGISIIFNDRAALNAAPKTEDFDRPLYWAGHHIQKELKKTETVLAGKTGPNPAPGLKFDEYRIDINPREDRNFAPNAFIEIKIWDKENAQEYKRGEAAHWIYYLEKMLGAGQWTIDESPVVVEDFDASVEAFIQERAPFHYAGVRLRVPGWDYLVPIRLGSGGTPADAAAHRLVNLLKEGYEGLQSIGEDWEGRPILGEVFPQSELLPPGAILFPVPKGNSDPLALAKLAAQILTHHEHPRTALMWSAWQGKEAARIEDFAEKGAEMVNAAWTASNGGTPRELTETDLDTRIRPLARLYGFGENDKEFLAWVVVAEKGGPYESVITKIIESLNEKHLTVDRIPVYPGPNPEEWHLTVSGDHNRPRILSEIARVFKSVGIKIFQRISLPSTGIPESHGGENPEGPFSILFQVKGDVATISAAALRIARIPDRPVESPMGPIIKILVAGDDVWRARKYIEGICTRLGANILPNTGWSKSNHLLFWIQPPLRMGSLLQEEIAYKLSSLQVRFSFQTRRVDPNAEHGGTWFAGEGYRRHAWWLETPVLFGAVLTAPIYFQDYLSFFFSSLPDPGLFFFAYPLLFLAMHVFNGFGFNRKDVKQLTLLKTIPAFLAYAAFPDSYLGAALLAFDPSGWTGGILLMISIAAVAAISVVHQRRNRVPDIEVERVGYEAGIPHIPPAAVASPANKTSVVQRLAAIATTYLQMSPLTFEFLAAMAAISAVRKRRNRVPDIEVERVGYEAGIPHIPPAAVASPANKTSVLKFLAREDKPPLWVLTRWAWRDMTSRWLTRWGRIPLYLDPVRQIWVGMSFAVKKVLETAKFSVMPITVQFRSEFENLRETLRRFGLAEAKGIEWFVVDGDVPEPLRGEAPKDVFLFWISYKAGSRPMIYAHHATLKKWRRKETLDHSGLKFGFFQNAILTATLRAMAEHQGVSHDELVNAGLDIEGLASLLRAGLGMNEVESLQVRRFEMLTAQSRTFHVMRETATGTGSPLEEALEALAPATALRWSNRLLLGDPRAARNLSLNEQKARMKSVVDGLAAPGKAMGWLKPEHAALFSKSIRSDDSQAGTPLFADAMESAIALSLSRDTDLKELRRSLRMHVLGAISHLLSEGRSLSESPGVAFNRLFAMTALLIGLGGDLWADADASPRKNPEHWRDLTVRLLVDVSALIESGLRVSRISQESELRESSGPPTNNELARELDFRAGGYFDEAMRSLAKFSKVDREVKRSLAAKGDVMVQVSKAMLEGKELTESEKTQLRVLKSHSGRAAYFLEEGVTDNLDQVIEKLAGNAGMDQSGLDNLNQRGGILVPLTRKMRTVEKSGKTTINGRAVLEAARRQGFIVTTIFALKRVDMEWDLQGVEGLAAFIVALAGDVVKDMTSAVDAKLRGTRFLTIQA